mgnify:CR=1 FL=1
MRKDKERKEVRCGSERVEQSVSIDTGLMIFFFQAEDGIRDRLVTGVQTCALPISIIPVITKHDRRTTKQKQKSERE